MDAMAPDIIIDDEKEWPLLLSTSGVTNPTHRSHRQQQTEPKNNDNNKEDDDAVDTTSTTKWEIIVDKTIDLPKPENHNNTLDNDDEWNIVDSARQDSGVYKDDSYYKVDTNTIDEIDPVVVDNGIDNNKAEPEPVQTLQRSRGNSISSPDLRNIHQHPIVITENVTTAEDTFDDEDDYYDDDDYYDEYDDCANYSTTAKDWDDTGSFSVISTVHPKSVVSCWSMNNNSSSNTSVRSFRDILLMNTKDADHQQQHQQQQTQQQKSHHSPHKSRRMMSKTRFVVVPTSTTTAPAMKRCAKSTNDIPSLVSSNDDHDNHGVEFYYSNKAMGARGRSNGLKLRPDESKRRDMIIHKKNLQRQASGVSSKKR